VKLWVRLRELRARGFHFRRQSPIARYVVDFECRRARVVVEIDGNQHGFDEHRIRDERRDLALTALGYRVLRFTNQDVDRNIEGVLHTIHRAVTSDLNDLHPVGLSAAHWAERWAKCASASPPSGRAGWGFPRHGRAGESHPASLRSATLPEDGEGYITATAGN